MKTYWSTKLFRPVLLKSSLLSWILRLLPISNGLITARILSGIVSGASKGEVSGVLSGGFFLLFFVLAVKVLEVLLGIAFEKAKARSVHCCKIKLYQIFLKNPLQVLFDSGHGRSIEKLNDDFEKVTQKSLILYPELGTGILTALIYFAFLFLQNGAVAGILLAISVLQIIPPIIVKRFMQVNYESCREIEAKLTDFTISSLRGFAAIKLYDLKEWWLEKLKGYHKDYSRIGSVSIFTNTAENTLNSFISAVLQYGTYAILGVMLLYSYIEMDICVETIALSGSFFAAVKAIFSSIPQLAVTKMAQERLEGWFDNSQNAGSRSLSANNTDITLQNISYAFEKKQILNNASAIFISEKICLIKGENGIGKSTLFHLMLGMLTDYKGEIELGGIDLRTVSEAELLKKIFYLPQEDVNVSLTPRMLYEMAAKEQLAQCLENAQKFGLSSVQIEETQIDELSGGERKKVYLALAFTSKSLFLLLDEPTNALDELGKNVLLELLRQRKGSALIITHDPLLEEVADECYVIRNQKIDIIKGGSVCEAKG